MSGSQADMLDVPETEPKTTNSNGLSIPISSEANTLLSSVYGKRNSNATKSEASDHGGDIDAQIGKR